MYCTLYNSTIYIDDSFVGATDVAITSFTLGSSTVNKGASVSADIAIQLNVATGDSVGM